jgi:predicted nucleic acid-binding protein
MNNYFIDTSALFKRYIYEPGTEEFDKLLKQDSALYISNFTIIELISNLKRKNEVSREFDTIIYRKLKSEFFNDIAKGLLRTVDIFSDIIINAVRILDNNYLTPIDSIQLASALQLKSEVVNVVFICSDKKLCRLAEKLELKSKFI